MYNRVFRALSSMLIIFLLCLKASFAQQADATGRQRLLMDQGWKFSFGHPYDTSRDFDHGTSYFSYLAKAGYGDGAAATKFDDRAWRKLNLPHDWAVEQDFSPQASYSHGFKAIGAKFPETTIGWYRKTFRIPASDLGRKISIDFDGVFRNSSVWVNGHYLGTEASGYNSFDYDISDVLNYGGDNVIAVRVDVGMEEGWFYEGAGIYRHVWLSKTNPIHVEKDGTFVTSNIDLASRKATVHAQTEIINERNSLQSISLVHTLLDASGKTVGTNRTDGIKLSPLKQQEVSASFPVANINLWDIEKPYLYTLVTTIWEEGKQTTRYETPFGFRTIRFDSKNGFFLNGKQLKLKGTNNHQDHAGVGAALPDELQYYRIKALKSFGSNAYRCSHNPPTPELLEACDKLGMLVIDENRLMATSGQLLGNFKKMIKRDRNHPSIILWSVGNEEWAIENSITGARIATTLQAYAKSLDSTRAITAGISGGFQGGISDVIEVMGYNYIANGDIDKHYQRFPNQAGAGTEEGSTFATRGIYVTDSIKHYAAAYDGKPRPTFYSIEEGWNFYSSRPHLAGMFIWTGFDYRGEPTPYGWPSVTSYFGMLDLCGFPKDNFYYLRSWWSDLPTLHLLPHWNWPGKEGKEIAVWAYSNCDEVELFLNGKSLGRKGMKFNSHLEWKVTYRPGTLEAVGYKKGKQVMRDVVKTTAAPSSISLAGHQPSIKADAEDLVVVTVSVEDKNKLAVPTADNEISFQFARPRQDYRRRKRRPVSLAKEKFIEDVKSVKITDLKEKELADISGGKALLNAEASSWKKAFAGRSKSLPAAYIYRGSFELPTDLKQDRITLYFSAIGKEQSIYINGKAAGGVLKDDQTHYELVLDKSLLKAGSNQIDIIAKPLGRRAGGNGDNASIGTVQIYREAAQWKRKLFSGLAQIIIQSTGEPGEITLSATSSGLKTGSLKINSTKSDSRLLGN